MKKIPSILIIVMFMIFGASTTDLSAKKISNPCGTFLIKFEWQCDGNGPGAWVPEIEGSTPIPHGITITGWTTKPGEPCDPITVSWESSEYWICAVTVKTGDGYINEDESFPTHKSSGTESVPTGGKAISHIVFFYDEILPVEMTSFSVILKNELAHLEWETATEVNNYGFEVQRQYQESSIKNQDWVKVGFVEGHGNSNSPKYYSFTDPSIANSGKYYYRLKQIDIDGRFEYSDVINIDFAAPAEFKLNQNYPNPFNPTTTISYSIPKASNVKITVYNIFGEEVETLVKDNKEAGSYSLIFNAKNLASGMYFYSIETDQFVQTRKFTLLK